jgi:DNA-binding NarL/FixJ family response regulator
MSSVSILIADDHPLTRQGLRTAIEKDSTFQVVAEVPDGETALAEMERLRPDIAVLDIEMPKRDGLQVAQEARARAIPTKIAFLTMHNDEDFFEAAIESGAKGYILKDAALTEIVSALRAIQQDRYYVPQALGGVLLQWRSQRASSASEAKQHTLTAAERNILRLIGAGMSSKEIAEELSIHPKTVENHRSNIAQKLGVSGTHALVRYALQQKGKL